MRSPDVKLPLRRGFAEPADASSAPLTISNGCTSSSRCCCLPCASRSEPAYVSSPRPATDTSSARPLNAPCDDNTSVVAC
jgi:hypothetical protein